MAPVPAARRRVSGLDGVRGIAVLMVVLGHAGVPHFEPGGSAGVTLFFVLSGFLITGVLLTEYDGRHRIGLGAFWMRRALRLLPALWLFIAVAGVLTVLFGWMTRHVYREAAQPALLYYANMPGRGVQLGPLQHTWSLAVEEQFYIVWPLILLVLLHLLRGRRSVLVLILATATLLGALWRFQVAYGTGGLHVASPRSDTWAFALLAGATLAAAHRRGLTVPEWMRWLSIPAAVAFIVVPIIVSSQVRINGVTGPLWFTAFGLVLIAACLQPHRTWMSTPALTKIGTVSYGWYLWHWPFMWAILTRHWVPDHPLVASLAVAACSFVAALLSWHLLEKHVLRFKARFEYDRRASTRDTVVEPLPPGPAVVAQER